MTKREEANLFHRARTMESCGGHPNHERRSALRVPASGVLMARREPDGGHSTDAIGARCTRFNQQEVIHIPRRVIVTAITPVTIKFSVGANVVVLAHKTKSGQLSASAVMLIGPTGK